MNKIINISNDIIEEQESFFFINERDEYLKKNINFDIEPEYVFNPEPNITQLEPLDEYLKKNINFDIEPESSITPLPSLENYNKLIEENSLLKSKIEQLEQKLKKYTNGDNHKRYYEKNKDKIKKEGLAYLKNLKLDNPDKIKEYNHNAYIKRKEKKKKLNNDELNESALNETALLIPE
jgi:hypothetical protein